MDTLSRPICCRPITDEERAAQLSTVRHWKVQGSLIKSRLLYLQMKHGIATLKRILQSLGEADRAVLTKTVFVGEWYELGLLVRLDAAIVAELGANTPDLLEALGAFSAELNIGGTYESLVQRDVEGFLQLSAVVSPTFQTFGSARYEPESKTGPVRAGTVCLAYDTPPPSQYCQSGIGYFRRAVELCGGIQPEVTVTSCRREGAPECRFRICWQPGGASTVPMT
ncbi:hypothetical protein [Chloracidobacterium aggregatum]|jgi:hypothetical protein|uniref:4-vinyl reductase 4VR domain-containing protein n=1 Tax=Chloracidobacterium sp. N TaxID=2821540 RepID=A0ABX8B2W4_9BACT|nr:hypothetical protein [Chloracidobacterium aggregatum]QUV86437.1 hypothetical protein J8C03_12400 [Chloracidobacterium sp. 2]QUV89132.1 hypothetical protein J8C07_15085 [Chloracidobacterium sp. S]QUV92061.1 hypothetical protein J8C04_14125 [Chloracidobacterium sp. A]QUV95334.1 hypothetical protein J8C05_15090 [Chloracidobacterium sp. N]QUV98556.1 hypothetical protein J8C00_11995 [Chloracidobacterium sp. E]